ncbi:unnamed protein product [Phytomonas sp. EM1]|nr:unnamed protein product [Phytomonas sp. EM1]|eukprot:CCW64454.1 unnamed protein product [Phytomonas sp. isolate EM1]
MSTVIDSSHAAQFLDDLLRRNSTVLISATYCQFSTQIKKLLIELKRRFVSVEIDLVPNGLQIFREVVALTGVHTVPQLFVQGKYLGGYDDIVALYRKDALSSALGKRSLAR